MQANDYATKASTSFVLPDICLRIREMLDDHNSDAEDIADLVSLDPSLAAKLLKLANSPLFRFRSQVDNIAKAVNILGGEALYNLVMAETAKDAFQHFSNDNMDLNRFWKQSLYTGLIAKHIAKLLRVRGSERFFLLGLLHNLAELVVTKESPEKALLCLPSETGIAPWALQQKVLGFTYAQCSSQILQMWQLPVQISLPLADIHHEDKALKNKEIAILYCAARLGYGLAFDLGNELMASLSTDILKSAAISDEILQDAVKFSQQEIGKMMTIFNSGAPK
ncbi:HDOD domain-containing protein [Aliiglaciecola sp. LCG003]|uniref:HDOD domain-containing protein n=1 Tax=Aliiglaciecola sp. LCG003 TaxID=3053655 RepID=UPI002572951B|nr:HDOD domain-containing protein [Aliiglaciecola sp. LCG003]WJG10214.1 HDOD domain-containing protein [Aliiglaciecola sp. LCG003]